MRNQRRRLLLKGLAALPAAPYLNLAHAQGARIPIGAVLPFTGNAGVYGPDMAEAMKRTVARINDAGGILGGRRIELLVEDSETSASAAANITQKLVNVHKCQALTGYWATPEALSSRPIAISAKSVQFVMSAADAITEGDTQGYVWRFQLRASGWGIVIGRAALRVGHKNICIMGLQNAFVMPIMKAVEAQVQGAGGKVVDSLIYNPEQPSHRAEVQRIFSHKVDAVYCFGQLADFVSIMKEVARNGFDTPVVALTVMADAEGKFVQAVGPKVAEGIRHFQPMPDTSLPGYKAFLKLMGAPDDKIYLFAPDAHDQVAVAALAMEKAGSPVGADWSKHIMAVSNGPGEQVHDVVEALKLARAGKPVNFSGAASVCDFAQNGDQVSRGMGHWLRKDGRNVFVEFARP
jgi:branched-chain amino acid transport system substrate-binding protein